MVAEWMERADAAAAPSKRHERNEPLTYSLRSLGCLLVPSRSLIPPPPRSTARSSTYTSRCPDTRAACSLARRLARRCAPWQSGSPRRLTD